jgi:hypothetical protein
VRGSGLGFLLQFFNFVLQGQFLAFQFDYFKIIGARMQFLGGDGDFYGLVTTLEFTQMRLQGHWQTPSLFIGDEIVTQLETVSSYQMRRGDQFFKQLR